MEEDPTRTSTKVPEEAEEAAMIPTSRCRSARVALCAYRAFEVALPVYGDFRPQKRIECQGGVAQCPGGLGGPQTANVPFWCISPKRFIIR